MEAVDLVYSLEDQVLCTQSSLSRFKVPSFAPQLGNLQSNSSKNTEEKTVRNVRIEKEKEAIIMNI